MKVIISDTTSLIVLEGLDQLGLICGLFNSVLIPQAVFNELVVGSPSISYKLQESTCIEIVQLPASIQLNDLLLILDQGEAAAITLPNERKGHRIA